MIFYVVEFQSNASGAVLSYAFDNKDDAEVKYHEVCMYAVKSPVRNHSVLLCDENMSFIKGETHIHNPVVEDPKEDGEE